MRRGSAVLLTILPMLSPAFGLPTYLGSDAAVAHANVERAALPEPAVNLDTAESINARRSAEDAIADWESEALPEWLPRRKRQISGASTTGTESGTVSLDVGASTPPSGNTPGGEPNTIENLGSYGPNAWLKPVGKSLKEREAEAEAEPAVTLDLDYVPPSLDTGTLNLGKPPTYKRRTLSL